MPARYEPVSGDAGAPRLGPDSGYSRSGRRDVFDGHVVHLHVDDVRMPDGSEAQREVVDHPGGVGIVAVNAAREVCLITQYRYPLGERIWEVPAGLRDEPGESAQQTAARELAEEVELRAAEWQHLLTMATSPGFSTEVVEIFLAQELTQLAREERHHEEAGIEVHWIPLDRAVEMVDAGEIRHAIAVAGLQAAQRRLGR